MELSSILNPETEAERHGYSAERADDPEGPPPPRGSGGHGTPSVGRKYPCKVCQRVFSTSGHLSRHMKVHTGERKYVCPFPGCNVKCNRSDNLLQHYRVHLPKEERKLGNTHVRDSLRRMNSYTSSSSSTGQVSPGVSEPQEHSYSPSQPSLVQQRNPALAPPYPLQHASSSHYPRGLRSSATSHPWKTNALQAPTDYTATGHPITHPAQSAMHLAPPHHRAPQQPLQHQAYPNARYIQSRNQHRQYGPPDDDQEEEDTSSSGSNEDEDEDEDTDNNDQTVRHRLPPSHPAGSPAQRGFPVSSSRYEGR